MNARPRREILRQSAVVVAIEHHGDAPLGNARQLRPPMEQGVLRLDGLVSFLFRREHTNRC